MASDRHMPEGLQWSAIGVGGLSIAAAIAFALLAAYLATHLHIDGPPPWTGAQHGAPPPIRGNAILQTNPGQDLRAFMAEKRALLDTYAWLDAGHSVARIPIERAMALVAESAARRRVP